MDKNKAPISVHACTHPYMNQYEYSHEKSSSPILDKE
jgi:hypothetical protein